MMLGVSASVLTLFLQTPPAAPAAPGDLLAKARAALGLAPRPTAVLSLAEQGRVRRFSGGQPEESAIAWGLWPPDKLIRREEGPEVSGVRMTRTVGYDGEAMWSSTNATGTTRDKVVRVREDPAYRWQMAEHLDREARAYSLVLLCDAGPMSAQQLVGEVQTPEGPAWAVDVIEFAVRFRLYLDKASLRPLKVSYRNNAPGVEAEPLREVERRVSAHQRVAGVLLPDRLTRTVDGVVQEEIETAGFQMDALRPEEFKRPVRN